MTKALLITKYIDEGPFNYQIYWRRPFLKNKYIGESPVSGRLITKYIDEGPVSGGLITKYIDESPASGRLITKFIDSRAFNCQEFCRSNCQSNCQGRADT